MHQDPKGARDERAITTWDEDECDQLALLRQVLELHPATLTRDELIRELNGRGRLRRSVDRFPHFVAHAGATGTVTEATDSLIALRMDVDLPGAEP
jgi:hypothetical protein